MDRLGVVDVNGLPVHQTMVRSTSRSGLILTGTRGSGKTTVAACLLAGGEFVQPVGVTTRPRRPDDRGVNEHITLDEFAELARAGELFVSSEYAGHRYGVSRAALQRVYRQGSRPLLTLTPEAAARAVGEPGWTAVFLDAPDATLDWRLLARDGSVGDAVRTQRAADRAQVGRFCPVWNDVELDAAVEAVRRTVEGSRRHADH